VNVVTFFSSFKSLAFRFWDEQQRRLVGFGALRTLQKRQNWAASAQPRHKKTAWTMD
jgi:hypothetical protein